MEMTIFVCGSILIAAFLFVLSYIRHRKMARRFMLTLFFDNLKIEGFIMAVTLTTTQQVTGELDPVDKHGKPAPVDDGSVEVTSSNDEVFVVERDPDDEKKFKLVAKGVGVATLDYSADADTGDGVVTISGFTAVEVLPAQAVGFGLKLGEVEEQPEPEA